MKSASFPPESEEYPPKKVNLSLKYTTNTHKQLFINEIQHIAPTKRPGTEVAQKHREFILREATRRGRGVASLSFQKQTEADLGSDAPMSASIHPPVEGTRR